MVHSQKGVNLLPVEAGPDALSCSCTVFYHVFAIVINVAQLTKPEVQRHNGFVTTVLFLVVYYRIESNPIAS